MRKLVWMAALSAMALFWTADFASARGHRGCGGGCGGGGCGGGYCGGGCGYGGGCGGGYCGGGYGGGYCGGGYCGGGGCYAYDGGAPYSGMMVAADTQAATLIVSLPANATLMVDEYRTTSTSSERVFSTPALKVGQEYHYTLKADLNGRSITRQVAVRAGETTRVSLDLSETVAAR
jgi:uncharacterized protein (TIGR03000 family)